MTDLLDARPSRREDDRLVRGAGRFVADVRVPECLDAAFVRSAVAHGRLRGVRLDEARAVPGVVAAWSAADFDRVPGAVPVMDPAPAQGRPWPALATDKVRYVGQPVGIVVARDRYTGEDGRDAARVDIEPLPALLDPTEAAGSDVRLFDGLDNVVYDKEFGAPIDGSVWRDAAVVVTASYRQELLAHTSMEARAILVQPHGDGRLTVWCGHQAPHWLRRDLAAALELAEADVRVVVPDVGGAFGGKAPTYPEYVAVAMAAVRLGRPVRWIEDRAEALSGPPRGRGQNHRVRLAADATGKLLAWEWEIDSDVGGYPHTGAFVSRSTAMIGAGPYAIPQVHVRARAVLTTTAPVTPYRGAGRPEAAAAMERTVDVVARRLGMDPAELRRRNHIPPGALPYRTPTGYVYDSGDYTAALDLALRTVDYGSIRAEQARRRRTGDGPPMGIGICVFVERSGAGPEFGSVEACPDGTFLALSGCSPAGQGHETAFGQVVAGVLDVPADLVRLVEADTDAVPRGIGSFAARSMHTGGAALHTAAGRLVDEARRRMADHQDVPVSEVDYKAGRVVAGTTSMTLGELAAATGPLRADEVAAPPESFPYGVYVAVVEVDPELGDVRVVRLVAVDDCGVMINPRLVRGQVYGSSVQGLGQALYEHARYDAAGRPQGRTLLDYTIPTLAEVPPMTLEETCSPNPNTALGAKGTGESGCIGVPPAIVNAVADALELEDPSVLTMPLTPYACWSAMRAGQRDRGAGGATPGDGHPAPDGRARS